MKAFSELDNNLECHFYDFDDRNLGNNASNPIRLQYLNRLSDSELNERLNYYHMSSINNQGIDLANENQIINDENLHDQLAKHQNDGFYDDKMGKIGKLNNRSILNGKQMNDKRMVFYNPKYERRPEINDSESYCEECDQLNNDANMQINSNYHSSKNNNNVSTNLDNFNQSECIDNCDLKFLNCNCTSSDDKNSISHFKNVKNKPPTGSTFARSRINNNLEIVDTKL